MSYLGSLEYRRPYSFLFDSLSAALNRSPNVPHIVPQFHF
jgi:hypothetical protein